MDELGLNSPQQRAVEYDGGPLMIIAGPGSGKTFVIVERVRRLVKGGTPPESILCLTFTRKAAEEMLTRLEKHRITDVVVGTFHAFAQDILRENSIEADIDLRTRLIQKYQIIAWCIRNTDKFGFDPKHLEIGNNRMEVYSSIQSAISDFKEEMIMPDDLQRYIDQKLQNQDGIDAEELKFLHMLNEFNKVYRMYEAYLREKNMLDYDDLVTRAIRVLQKDAVIRARYQAKFQHVLVDEFQDNNIAQFKLVKQLVPPGHQTQNEAGKRRTANITVVGDEDQCIMRFQGAYFGIFDDFNEAYPDRQIVKLEQNYRSTANIVSIAKQLLEMVPNRTEKKLFTKNPQGDPIKVVRTPTDKGQTEYIVEAIRQMVDSGDIKYDEIAILSRRRSEVRQFAQALNSLGIPAIMVGDSNIFELPVILELISYLKIANSPAAAGMEIFRLLRSHGIADQNIMAVTSAARRRARYETGTQHDFVLEALRMYNSLDVTQKPEVAELLSWLDQIISSARTSSVLHLVYHIMMNHSDVYKRTVQAESGRNESEISALNRFYTITREYQELFPEGLLSDFLEHLSILSEMGIDVSEEITPPGAVNVLTIHKSKGKEFPVVFITDMADRRFPTRYTERKFYVPTDLLSGTSKTQDSQELHKDEERRLFYVGMTRAKRKLIITYPQRYGDATQNKRPSEFLKELDYDANPLIETGEFTESEDFDMQPEERTESIKNSLQKEAASAINRMNLRTALHRIVSLARVQHFEKNGSIDGFDPVQVLNFDVAEIEHPDLVAEKKQYFDRDTMSLSASSIGTYQTCPLQFKFQNILQAPQRPSAALDLGSAFHTIAERLGEKKADGGTLSAEDGIKAMRSEWIFRSHPDKTSENSSWKRAEQMIGAYVKWESESKNKILNIEKKFNMVLDGFTFTGKIDRIEKSPGGEYEIVDFKTGKNAPAQKNLPDNLQLNIYAKAVEESKKRLPAKASLFYPELEKTLEYRPTSESVKKVIDEVLDMARRIDAGDFEPTPSAKACRYCSYRGICDVAAPIAW